MSGATAVGRLAGRLRRPELGAVAGAVLVLALFAAAAGDSGMFSARGVVSFLEVSAHLGILAAAAALLMIGGEFDLSMGSMIAFAGMCIAIPVSMGAPVWAGLALAFAAAALVGWLNGVLVVRTNLPSFIVTLATLFIVRGVTLGVTRLLTGRTQVSGLAEAFEADWLAPLFNGHLFGGVMTWAAGAGFVETRLDGAPAVAGLPMSVAWWMALTAAGAWLLARSPWGNWIFAVGGDVGAARNAGVPVRGVKISLFVGTAVAAALLGAVQVLGSGSADTTRGLLKEFEAIIAVVIGGTLLTGGYGSVVGAALGALIFGTVKMGIFYTGVDTDWFQVFLGIVLLGAVVFNDFVRRVATEARA